MTTKILRVFIISPVRATHLAHLILFYFTTVIICGGVKIMKRLVKHFSSPVTSSLLDTNVRIRNITLNTKICCNISNMSLSLREGVLNIDFHLECHMDSNLV
jgi:hypothetical protein